MSASTISQNSYIPKSYESLAMCFYNAQKCQILKVLTIERSVAEDVPSPRENLRKISQRPHSENKQTNNTNNTNNTNTEKLIFAKNGGSPPPSSICVKAACMVWLLVGKS